MQEGCREVKASLGYRGGSCFAVIFIFLSGARVEDVAQVAECWAHTPEALCSSTAETVVVQTCNPASESLEGRDQKFKLCSDIEA